MATLPHLPAQPGIDYITDPETPDALGKLTALQFVTRAVTNPRHIPHAIADLDGDTAVELVPAWANTTTNITSTTAETSTSTAAAPATRPTQAPTDLKAFPAQSRRDADTAPIVIATAVSTIAGIATAKAFGATIRILDDPDPRYQPHHHETSRRPGRPASHRPWRPIRYRQHPCRPHPPR